MTDTPFDVSRRRLLAGLGTVGLASARSPGRPWSTSPDSRSGRSGRGRRSTAAARTRPPTAENSYWGSSGGPFEIQNNDDDGDVPPVCGGSEVDLDTVAASAVAGEVDFDPFATSSQ
jgi:hypothetical protein